ncbi:MAG: hypothetical protein ACREUW_12505 [Burkholderiales bacterium]
MSRWMILLLVVACASPVFAAEELDRTPVEATTAKGEKVRLYPNGRWEYVSTEKQATAAKVAEQYPENKTRPMEAQGCLLGIGRCLMPGDKDYNRGSLNKR